MKSRWQRSAVKVSGHSAMRGEPEYQAPAVILTSDILKIRDGLLRDGVHPRVVTRILRDRHGVATNWTSHRSRLYRLRATGRA